MIRVLFFLAVVYIIYKIVQVVLRAVGSPQRPSGPRVYNSRNSAKPPQQFNNVKDAEFEDITPKDEKKTP